MASDPHVKIKAFIILHPTDCEAAIRDLENTINAFLLNHHANAIKDIHISACNSPYGSATCCPSANPKQPWWYLVVISYVE